MQDDKLLQILPALKNTKLAILLLSKGKSNFFFTVLSGNSQLYKFYPDGKNHLYLLGANEVFSEVATFSDYQCAYRTTYIWKTN